MKSSSKIASQLFQQEQQISQLGRTAQTAYSTVGGEKAIPVASVVEESAVTNDALPAVQDDAAAGNDGVADLQDTISTNDDDLDAQLEDALAELDDARADVAAAVQEVSDAFGQGLTDLSTKVDQIVVGAGGGVLLLFSTVPPTSDDKAPPGSTWWMLNAEENIAGQWQQTGTKDVPVWTPRLIASETFANLDVGKLSAGQAAIAELVALKIAASTANIQTVNVGNLFVTEGATMQQAVIEYLFANVVQAKMVTAGIVRTSNSDTRVEIQNETVNGQERGTLRFFNPGTPGGSAVVQPVVGGIEVGNPGDGDYGMIAGLLPDTTIGGLIPRPDGQAATMPRSATAYTRILRVGQEMAAPRIYDPRTGYILMDDTGWVPLAVASAYTGTRGASVSRVGQFVTFVGQITCKNGTMTDSDTNLFTLEPQFRPSRDLIINAGGPAGLVPRLSIGANGVVGIFGLPTGYSANYIILDSISPYRVN
ncbi:hypothetical protein DEJ30_11885 [Curtobacterium sp. MCPF17_003]|uniref:hypothetical protein n=1 Tax=Curtobacterium sp. MCPF17_003 TaxID=2175637 RepID=UPI000D9351EA|nr:hypothetical protein [Curtobacterium sp. MCPF17_003]PYY63606.1 hypothetical protein DEJ30_11885 [Curtobacterium sp. MCPF17_003]